jgi:hypothetical protein
MTKYYHATNCNRTIVAGKFAVNFTPYEHVGTWMGIYASSNPAEIEALDALAKTRKIDELTETEYAGCLKKKLMATGDYSGSLAATAPTPGQAAAAPSAAPTAVKPAAPAGILEPAVPASAPLATVADAITAVPVQPKATAEAK